MRLGVIINKYRKSRCMSIREFAKLVGCSHEYIRKIEKQDVDISYKLFIKIASVMHYNLEELKAKLNEPEEAIDDFWYY